MAALSGLARSNSFDDGFANDSVRERRISTQGTLRTRYLVGRDAPSTDDALTAIIDTLIEDAKRLGIEWRVKHLYYHGDGESTDYPPPKGWRQLLAAQCERIGWLYPYALSEGLT